MLSTLLAPNYHSYANVSRVPNPLFGEHVHVYSGLLMDALL